MTYAERLQKLAPNLTSRQREILMKKRLTGLIIGIVGVSLIIVGAVLDVAARGLGTIPVTPSNIVPILVLMIVGLVVVLVGYGQLREGDLILRGAMATSHPDDSFTDHDTVRLYSRTKVVGTPSATSPSHPDTTPRYCPYCGVENSKDYSFCRKCGRPLPPPL